LWHDKFKEKGEGFEKIGIPEKFKGENVLGKEGASEPKIFRLQGPLWIDFQRGMVDTGAFQLLLTKQGKELRFDDLFINHSVILLAPPASGKSVLLRYICYELCTSKKSVYFVELKRDKNQIVRIIDNLAKADWSQLEDEVYFLVDDVHLDPEHSIDIFNLLCRPSFPKCYVIMAGRDTPNLNELRDKFEEMDGLEIQLNANVLSKSILQHFVRIKEQEIRYEDVSSYAADLWAFVFALKAFADAKGKANGRGIFEDIYKQALHYHEKAPSILLALANFYAFELPVDKFAFKKILQEGKNQMNEEAVQKSKIERKRKANMALNPKRRNIFSGKSNCGTASEVLNALIVFISYSTDDGGDLAGQLKRAIEKDTGISVFVDKDNIGIGESWKPKIITTLNKCDVFIPILTVAACRSNNVRKEIAVAIDKKKRIIPCVYDQVLPNRIPDSIEGLQRITFNDKHDLSRQVLGLPTFNPHNDVVGQVPKAKDAINVRDKKNAPGIKNKVGAFLKEDYEELLTILIDKGLIFREMGYLRLPHSSLANLYIKCSNRTSFGSQIIDHFGRFGWRENLIRQYLLSEPKNSGDFAITFGSFEYYENNIAQAIMKSPEMDNLWVKAIRDIKIDDRKKRKNIGWTFLPIRQIARYDMDRAKRIMEELPYEWVYQFFMEENDLWEIGLTILRLIGIYPKLDEIICDEEFIEVTTTKIRNTRDFNLSIAIVIIALKLSHCERDILDRYVRAVAIPDIAKLKDLFNHAKQLYEKALLLATAHILNNELGEGLYYEVKKCFEDGVQQNCEDKSIFNDVGKAIFYIASFDQDFAEKLINQVNPKSVRDNMRCYVSEIYIPGISTLTLYSKADR
jgi:hypothetical protein